MGQVNLRPGHNAVQFAGLEAAAAVVTGVTLHHCSSEAHLSSFALAVFDQFPADALALTVAPHRCGGEDHQTVGVLAFNVEAAEHHITDDLTVLQHEQLQLGQVVLLAADLLHQCPHNLALSRVILGGKDTLHQLQRGQQIFRLHGCNGTHKFLHIN